MSLANLRKMLSVADADDRAEGCAAYRRYNETMRMFADFYAVPLEGVTAAFVALSPNSDYHGNLRSLASVLRAIQEGAAVENITVSTYKHCRDRAYRYATGAEPFVTPDRGPKTLAFYHNILDPEDPAHVTIDGHIVCAYHGFERTMVEAKVRGRKEYRQISSDMQKLARKEGLVPCQLQATIWFARKRTLGIKYKAQLSLFADPTDKWNTRLHPKDVQPYAQSGMKWATPAPEQPEQGATGASRGQMGLSKGTRPMIEEDDLLNLLPGAKVIVTGCEGNEHSNSSAGCLCALKGTIQTVGKRYETMFAGTPTWWLEGLDKRVRLSEITLIKEAA